MIKEAQITAAESHFQSMCAVLWILLEAAKNLVTDGHWPTTLPFSFQALFLTLKQLKQHLTVCCNTTGSLHASLTSAVAMPVPLPWSHSY